MLSILINAYACSPNMGSEPGMAWNWCTNLAKYCELHIITEGEFKDKIEATVPSLPQGKNMHFYYNPVSEDVRKMCWNQGDWRFYYYYKKWQKKTLEIAKEIVEKYPIDIIHQLNMVGFREPGYLWKIEKPFIWGPIAGIGNIPFSFLKDAKLKFKIFFLLKNRITQLQLQYSKRVIAALKKANYIFTVSPEAKETIYKYHKIKTFPINETGCISPCLEKVPNKNKNFTILWVGRFIYTKQLQVALDTIAQIKHLGNIEFHIIGQSFNSQESISYKKHATLLGIDHMCTWHGLIPHDKVLDMMKRADLFFFTSIFEATSTVILEAIENSLPILCFNRCGFGPLIDSSIGYRIPLSTPQQSINDFAEKITYLFNHRDVLKQMSENCRVRQEELSWDNKAKQMVSLYKKVLSQK